MSYGLCTYFVNIEHVQVDSAKLYDERVSQCLAGTHIGLQNTAELLHSLLVFQDVHVARRLQK